MMFGRLLCAIGIHRLKMVEHRWAGVCRGFIYLLECQRHGCDGSKYE